MVNKTFIIICVVVAVVFFIFGGGAVFCFYKLQSVKPQNPFGTPSQLSQSDQTIKELSSNVIVSTLADGQVSDINGQNVTLASGGASIPIPFTASTEVDAIDTSALASQDNGQKQVDLSYIKVGDELSVNFNVLSDGSFNVTSAFDSGPASSSAQVGQ